jgi:hypothetical protein
MHVSVPMHVVVRLVPDDARLVSGNAHAGRDRYARGDCIYMCPLPTPANVAT